MPDAPDTPIAGRMIVTFHENGTGRPSPHVTFDPVGRITPGLLDHYHLYICGEIEMAQARVRLAARQPLTSAPPQPARRRRA